MPPTQMSGRTAQVPNRGLRAKFWRGGGGKGHLRPGGVAREGYEKRRHLHWIWKILFPPEEEGPGLGVAKTWSLGLPPEHPGIPPAGARARGGRDPRRRVDSARARRGRSRSTSTGVAGSGLCLRVKHESPEHLRLDRQIGKKGMEGPERRRRFPLVCCSASKKPSSHSVSAVLPETGSPLPPGASSSRVCPGSQRTVPSSALRL